MNVSSAMVLHEKIAEVRNSHHSCAGTRGDVLQASV
jgi:hypothetical protein